MSGERAVIVATRRSETSGSPVRVCLRWMLEHGEIKYVAYEVAMLLLDDGGY